MDDLRIYNTESEFSSHTDIKYPTICYISETNSIKWQNKPLKTQIAYNINGVVNYADYDEYDVSMGSPVGIIVIPKDFLPDGKARMMHLYNIDANGSVSNTAIKFSTVSVDSSLTNFNKVPTTDNLGSTTTGTNNFGYLPSDAFVGHGAQSFVDPKAYYNYTDYLIPSPYLGDTMNPEYSKSITGYTNCMSDLDGLKNTNTFSKLGSNYTSAKAVAKLTDRTWYIPAIGELGFVLARLGEINTALQKCEGHVFVDSVSYWSSTERDASNMFYLYTAFGVGYTKKTNSCYLRPFTKI